MPASPATGAAKPPDDARARLLMAGLRLFAQQGFSKTSTRELAELANVNVASISYYFGDKAGLYRAVFIEPMGSPDEDIARLASQELPLADALRGFYAGFLEPLKQGDVARHCMKLHFREMLEPTGLWAADPTFGIQAMHDALIVLLCRHLGLATADADLQRLAIGLAGLGVHMHVGRDITDRLAPGINEGDAAIDLWTERLTMYGLAMVQAEAARRGQPLAGAAGAAAATASAAPAAPAAASVPTGR
ncbi:MAG: CerR family C-terminal domain-containing protein [Rubrivivax sp.]|nr:CerR family C-terminal domain-containing protein [Rubrivivax sp.]